MSVIEEKGPPALDVLWAFGADEASVVLPGGEGRTYRAGDIVLKPADDESEANGLAELQMSIRCEGFRLAQPVNSLQGDFVCQGWVAWEFLEGRHEKGRWLEEIDLCLKFHEAISEMPRPSFLDTRAENSWTVADQVAWGEREIEHHPRIAPAVERLQGVLRPVSRPSQLIHGDFGGNVLFEDGLPPAVIDLSLYWRPVAFAVGVVVADAIVWEGADESLMDAAAHLDEFYQHLARAELRRVVELETAKSMHGRDMIEEIDAHLPVIESICRRCA